MEVPLGLNSLANNIPYTLSATCLVDLHACILTDDSRTRTWCVQQDSIESTHDLRELSGIVVADGHILATHAMDVGSKGLCSLLI